MEANVKSDNTKVWQGYSVSHLVATYLDETSVVTRVLKSGRRRQKKRIRRRYDECQKDAKLLALTWRKGVASQGRGWPLDTGKGKEMGTALEIPEENVAVPIL